jgi:GNAT superfamily N-acetyltransferase
MDYSIIKVSEIDAGWPEVLALAARIGDVEVKRLNLQADYFLSSHLWVAWVDSQPVGFLRFVVQRIGEDEDRPLVIFNGQVLEEAKVITFAVYPAFQNKGLGHALQRAAMDHAKGLGCYQFRSRSHYRNAANHHLKIGMGFGIQPSLQDDSLYFVWPFCLIEMQDFHAINPSE